MLAGLTPRTSLGLIPRQAPATDAPSPARVFAELGRYAGPDGIPPPASMEQLAKRYGLTVWVYAAVHRRAVDAAAIPLQVMRRRGGELVEAPEADPFRQLLRLVNPLLSYRQLREQDQCALDLTGNQYWLIFPDRRGMPAEIWPLLPQWVQVIPDAETLIGGYAVRPGGAAQVFRFPPIARSNGGPGVLHFRRHNPVDAYYGQGCLQAAWGAAMIDEKATEYRHAFYRQSARPDGMLTWDSATPPGKNAVEQVREWWQQAFQGPANAHKVAILPGWKFIPLSFSPKDADIIADRKMSREDILVAFGVSLAVLGIETGDVGRRDEQIRHYYRSTILPEVSSQADAITEFLAPLFGDDYEVHPDTSEILALREDEERQARIDEMRLRSAVITVNEVRARDGLERVAWGDVPLVPFSIAPLGSVPSFGALGLSGAPHLVRVLPGNGRLALGAGDAEREQIRTSLWTEFIAKADPIERALVGDVARAFVVARDAMASGVEAGEGDGAITTALIGLKATLQRIGEQRFPAILEAGFAQGVRFMERLIGSRGSASPRCKQALDLTFTLDIPRLAEFVASRPVRYADEVAANLSPDFRAILTEELNAGRSILGAAQRISEQWDVLTPYRANLIARTESIGAMNLAAHVSYRESGVVDRQEWLSSRDDRVRDTHLQADGQVVALTESFTVGGTHLRFPGDPQGDIAQTAMCRCVVLPLLEGE